MPSERTLRIASAIVAVLGMAVATYITIADAGGGSPVCVAGGGGCETVAKSSYSHLAGINVAVFGVLGYIGLLGAAAVKDDRGRLAALLLSVIGFGFSAYLTYLELFVIDAICQWCIGSAILMTISMLIAITRAAGYLGALPPASPDMPDRQAPPESLD